MKVRLKDGEIVFHRGDLHIRNGEIIDVSDEDYNISKEMLVRVDEEVKEPKKKKKTFGEAEDD